MIRVGLSIYLALVSLAGPSFCCCATSRWLADLLPAPAQSAGAERPACCHRDAKRAPTERPSQSPHKTCPCRSGAPEVQFAPTSPTTDIASNSARSIDGDWASIACPDLWASGVAVGPKGGYEAPDLGSFVTTRDLLRAHHVLRC